MFAADFVYLAAFNRNILVIEIIELNLHYLNLRILCKDPVKNNCLVMERESDMVNLSFFLQFKCSLICAALLKELEINRILCVHEIEVKIINSACLKLAFKKRSDVLF
jgi:hypothetical protein